MREGGGGGSMFCSLVYTMIKQLGKGVSMFCNLVYTMIKTIDLKVSENHDSAVLDGGIVILKCIG